MRLHAVFISSASETPLPGLRSFLNVAIGIMHSGGLLANPRSCFCNSVEAIVGDCTMLVLLQHCCSTISQCRFVIV